MFRLSVQVLAASLCLLVCYGSRNPLRAVNDVGSPWPMPKQYKTTEQTQLLLAEYFRFRSIGRTCDILESAMVRYHNLIFYNNPMVDQPTNEPSRNAINGWYFKELSPQRLKRNIEANGDQMLMALLINLENECEEYPSLQMDESYTLSIEAGTGTLSAKSIWGVLRGLETFSQLSYRNGNTLLAINNTYITDEPRFAWRGILLDTSRHYLPVETLLQNLDAMAYNKINVFHWHIVDDESFPYQSKSFPEISNVGAYDPYTHVYTQEDVKRIIEHARFRGIRVVPEFDSPGHSRSWGYAIGDLLTPCCNKAGHPNGHFGPINPILDTTYNFALTFFKELTEVFKDKYMHLGGDEVDFGCWQSNPNITVFMKEKGFGKDYSRLESYYIEKLLAIVESFQAEYVVWQEIFDNNVTVLPDTVIEVWKSTEKELYKVTKAGLRAIYSTPWYLDHISYGRDWQTYYSVEPLNFNGTAEQEKLLIGGEACLWASFVDATNVDSRLWPRASAVAERLWSPRHVNDAKAAAARIDEHRCRMVRRGIYAEPPNGPGFCPVEATLRAVHDSV